MKNQDNAADNVLCWKANKVYTVLDFLRLIKPLIHVKFLELLRSQHFVAVKSHDCILPRTLY